MIISIINLKGGVAKTTTSIYLAQAAGEEGFTPIILDADPQASAYQWREKIKEPVSFMVAMAPSPFMLENTIRKEGRKNKLIIIDTPPSDSPVGIIASAIKAADFIVIPTKAGSLEPERVVETIYLCGEKPKGILITDAFLGTNCLRETIDGWKSSSYELLDVITHRAAIATDASTEGINTKAVAQHKLIINKIINRERVSK